MSNKGRKLKVKKERKLLFTFTLCSLVFLCTMIFSLYKMIEVSRSSKNMDSSEGNILLKNRESNKDSLSKVKDVNETIIKISAVGDCTLGSDTDDRGNSFTSVYNKKDDPSYFFSGVKNILSSDSLTIANLEGPLTTRGEKSSKRFSFRGSPEYTKILTTGSVEAVNLANNHSMDYGQIAYDDTKKYLKGDGIEYFGNNEKSIIEKNGIKIGLLGYKGWSSSNQIKKNIELEIKRLKSEVNLIIVSFHWGDERAKTPNNIQKSLGKLAIDSGADLVLGHHPHVIQGIEEYNGKYIVYSLGNFSFGGNTNPKDKDSFIYQQSFKFDSSKKNIKIETPLTIPVSISSSEGSNDYRPYILEGEEKSRVLKKIEERSKIINY
ncbi:CapA family protein [Clostridium cylindrosporum]|uniref:PGA biosynthesis protein CapA n=1 Tax=Clostridium cylindrosporum DSM 605 TaxID=1121307 RepID=A0A0J8DEI2_CLOCY|nr:CapA family protein [Clostridium cylindrosporum]KMT22598.1 PGA biosynthesis protein CapA [Clostridium cylindrosporum DSM 605]